LIMAMASTARQSADLNIQFPTCDTESAVIVAGESRLD
jgi:hypothetical protein